jgi:IS5 family transposase
LPQGHVSRAQHVEQGPSRQFDQEPGAEARPCDAPNEEGQAQWYFGMKAHVGVDSKTKMIHSVVVTAANVADSTVLPELLHGEETKVWGDQAYRGQTEAMQEVAPGAQDMTHKQYRYKDHVDEIERAKNRTKSRVRSKVEHVFGVMKLKFGFVKVRYRGLKKNANRFQS